MEISGHKFVVSLHLVSFASQNVDMSDFFLYLKGMHTTQVDNNWVVAAMATQTNHLSRSGVNPMVFLQKWLYSVYLDARPPFTMIFLVYTQENP